MKNIITQIKTTLLGLAILGFTAYKFNDIDTIPFYVLITLGVVLLLAPDTAISGLKRFVSRKSKEL